MGSGVRGTDCVEIIEGKGGYAPTGSISGRGGRRGRGVVLTTLDQLCLAAADCGLLCGHPWVQGFVMVHHALGVGVAAGCGCLLLKQLRNWSDAIWRVLLK